ncbi:uncharacterized protein YlxW (UPF0749 family) [Kribbella orskensis]|uniref:Uncharacterized protein YlxW (UPF0749 family) n=1 Tax=Kribbella orskensis TaxID=2512216 RepID=A0ABY2BU24_9ACTN|nr:MULTISPECIES: DUF881 domain-containing protein [Kribbella]TCN43331.1 uncharacterized protein YlxW (UPF0749 family) [Kribbella sp. VKM Ac-2500]TCO29313.1 uncharacterized protein YlxW (UPF0749 family) [Kribbella orskensis]
MSTDDPIPPSEPPKPDPPTPDPAEVDPAEVDPTKIEQTKVDPTEVEQTKVDPTRVEQPAPDVSKAEAPSADDLKPEPFEGASGAAAGAEAGQSTDPDPDPEPNPEPEPEPGPEPEPAVQPGSPAAKGKPRHAGDSARARDRGAGEHQPHHAAAPGAGEAARADETAKSTAEEKSEPAEDKPRPPEPVSPDHPAAPTPMPRPRTPNLALRRLKAGFKPSRGQAIIAVVLALVACVAVVQVRVNRADDGYQNARREDLIAILDGLGQNTRRLESEITELEARKNTLSSSADKAQTAREQAEQQVRVLGILAGTLPAQGPGVRITLNDPDGKMTSSNLLDAIEELRDAGAEAIQINGAVRVVASTDLIDDPPGVKVDGEKVGSPYVIEAIGESHNLAEAANFPGGLVSEVTGPQIGGTAEVVELPLVQITALHAPDEHRYARPAPSPTK